MSIISAINNNDDPKFLFTLLKEYEKDYQEAEHRLKIPKNALNEVNREHASWQLWYEEKKTELYILSKYMDLQVGKARSKLYVGYTQTHNRDLTEPGKKQYIEGEPSYINANIRALEVKEMYEKYQNVCNAFQSRGYSINNLTKLSIAEIKDISY